MPTKMRAKGLTIPKSATPRRQVKVAPEGIVTAIVAVTGVVDAVEDLIVPGAFAHTLRVRRPKVVDDHQWGNKAGRVLHVEEWMPGDSRLPKRTKEGRPWPKEAGALVATMQYNLASERGRESYEWVRFYAESNEAEFSIGYKVPAGKARKRGDGVRVILMVDLFEFSHVLFGAAPLSMALDVKSATGGVRVPDTIDRPALTDDDDDDTAYDESVAAKPWDDDDTTPRARVESKTAASVLLEAKAGGADRNRGNAEQLRRWFLSPESGIGWGTPGDHTRCVAIAAKHMTKDQAHGYCNLRSKEATGHYSGEHESKSADHHREGKAMSKMKGSYEERIALLNAAAEDLFRTTYNAAPDGHLAVCPVATYATEAVFTVYDQNDARSYVVPYTADDDGQVELAEPQEVELSLVMEAADGSAEQVDDVTTAEVLDALRYSTLETTEGKAAAAVTEAKAAPAPDTQEGTVEPDEQTITADNLPDGDWQTFRKTEPIEALRMDGPFSVQTREGVVKSEGGWLAKDSAGQPYPIAEDEMDAVYEPVDAAAGESGEDVPEAAPADDDVNDYAPPEPGEDDEVDNVITGDEAPAEGEVAEDVETPAADVEDDTEGKGLPADEDDSETVTLDPDEVFATRESLDAGPIEDDEED